MRTTELRLKVLQDAVEAGRLLGVDVKFHYDVTAEQLVFEMLLRIARRLDDLEKKLDNPDKIDLG